MGDGVKMFNIASSTKKAVKSPSYSPGMILCTAYSSHMELRLGIIHQG